MDYSRIREICNLAFTEEMKGLSKSDADCFTVGMEKYFQDLFSLKGKELTLDEEWDYIHTEFSVTSFSEHEYWPYSPQFIRVFYRILSRLFDVGIQYVTISDPGEIDRKVILTDSKKAAWVIKIKKQSIYIMYPRKGLEYQHYARVTPIELHELSDQIPCMNL